MSAHLALYHARGAGRLCKTIPPNPCYRFLCAVYISKVAGVALHQHAWRLQHRAAALCRRRRRQVARSSPTAISSQIRLLRLPRLSVAPIDLHLRCSCWPVCAATQPQPNMSAARAVAHATSPALSAVRCLSTAYATALSPARAASLQPLQTIHATRS